MANLIYYIVFFFNATEEKKGRSRQQVGEGWRGMWAGNLQIGTTVLFFNVVAVTGREWRPFLPVSKGIHFNDPRPSCEARVL